MKKLYFFVTIIIIITAVNLYAEAGLNDITMQQFLLTAEKDTAVENLKELTDAYIDVSLNTPVFDRVEAITETNEFDIEKQRYALRFYPKGWGERKYGNKILEAQKTLNRFEYDVKFNDAVKLRYDLALEYLEVSSLLKINRRLLVIVNEYMNTLDQKKVFSLYLQTEEKLTDINLKMVELQNMKTGIISRINSAAASTASIYFDQESLATFDNLNEVVSRIAANDSTVNAALSKMQNDIDLKNNEYLLEKVKNKNLISYIQGDFDADHAPDFEKTYSLKLAVKLPFINSGREELTRLKRLHILKKLDFLESRNAVSEEIKKLNREFQRYQRQFKVLADVKQKRNDLVGNDGLNKKDRFTLQFTILKTDERLAMLDAQIRSTYIRIVDLSGDLSAVPLKNFIAR